MKFFTVKGRSKRLSGEINLPGDKSIACRSIIISAISQGKTLIENFPANEDCLYSIKAFQRLGVKITRKNKVVTVTGKGLFGLKKPKIPVFAGDSGTTFRLMLGVLAGQDFSVTLTAGKSLSRRPMLRVTQPLRIMGAKISARHLPVPASPAGGRQAGIVHGACLSLPLRQAGGRQARREEYPPITIKGGNLSAITYKMPVASAQVKSAILLAGLYAKGATRVIERAKTRDHTERMLRLFKADIKVKGSKIILKGERELRSCGRMIIPGDISSASFFIVLAAILPGSEILIKNVGLNSSRIGIIKVLKRMGANIRITNYAMPAGRQGLRFTNYEPTGDLAVRSSTLKGTIIRTKEIPSLIDELPILMAAASFAKGKSIFEGVSELRVKEADRIRSMSENLKKMGADIRVVKTLESEKIIIQGAMPLKGTRVKSFGDHRTAMSMVVAGLSAQGEAKIDNISCINKSFPEFLSILKALLR